MDGHLNVKSNNQFVKDCLHANMRPVCVMAHNQTTGLHKHATALSAFLISR